MFNYLQKLHQERRDKAKKVKEQWVKSGEHDKTVKLIHEKMERRIKPEDLPF